ncbi:ABC transporter permease [Phocaeicola sp.]
MKFIYHNIKMLMNRARSNGWVLGELFVVFIVLWYLCDSIGCLTYTVTRPQGVDFDHIYEVQLIKGGEAKDTTRSYEEKVLLLRDRLRRLTDVIEVVGMHYHSDPMGANNRWMDFFCADTVSVKMRYTFMDDGMMEIFRFRAEPGQPEFSTMPATGNYVMLTREAVRRMQEAYPPFTTDSTIHSRGNDVSIHIHSVLADFRPGRFVKAQAWNIVRINDNTVVSNNGAPTLMIRLHPHTDRSDFPAYFMKEIAPVVEVDNVMVLGLIPYTQTIDSFEQVNGDRDRLQIHSFIALFLLVNVFMGIVGTFWYRTRRRRSEIALRLSMGSSRKQVRRLLLGEGLILLTIVAIPAMVVCFNIAWAEPTVGNSPLIAVWAVKWSFLRFILGSVAAWLLMAAMIVFGIWAPATRAMKIQPAEALHEE